MNSLPPDHSAPKKPSKGLRDLRPYKIIRLMDHTPSVRELVLESEDELTFRAGQFVMIHVPPKPFLRAYSIASREQDKNRIHLIFKYVEQGVASNYIWSLKGDETLQITGPFGRVFFQEPPTEQVLFLNTGTGVTQHLSYLLSKAELYPNTQFRMLFGLRNRDEIYHQDVLDDLAKKYPHFKYEFVLSNPHAVSGPRWEGKTGYVQNHLKDFAISSIPTTVYLCGNGNMIKEAKRILLEEEKLDPTRVLSEAFD